MVSSQSDRRGLEFGVLGPLQVTRRGAPLRLGGRQQRAVLALLLLDSGTVVSTDRLADVLWGERPPKGSTATLHTYISHLRDLFEPDRARSGPSRMLLTEPTGYRLVVDGSSIDAAVFERCVRSGRAILEAGRFAEASAELAEALALWRGPVLADLADYEFARLAAAKLEELRLGAIEARVEADLALGQHAELVAELDQLTAANPVRERLQGQRMLALYRSGRQADALAGYHRLRESLADELGIDPGPALQELHRRILRQDPVLGTRPGEPRALPVPPNALLGREGELAELAELLRRDEVRLLVLTGAGGSGKTRLALEAARQAAGSFANGAAFVGLAPLRDPDLVIGAIAQAVGVQLAPGVGLAAALGSRQMLLVLDNLEHLRAAGPSLVELLARAARLTLLVTSRVVLRLSGERVYPVEPLAADAAAALFVERAREAEPRFRPDPADAQAVRVICRRLDGLPLAIELAASRVRMAHPGRADRPARTEPAAADRRPARLAGTAADAARDDRVELRAARQGRAA